MTSEQLYKRECIQKGIANELTPTEIAERLDLNPRRIRQIIADYKNRGDTVFIHGNTGKVPANKVAESEAKRILEIRRKINAEPHGFSYCYFHVILSEDYQIDRSVSYLRKLLIQFGFKSPEKHRVKKAEDAHLLRERRESFGELIQADGTSFDWFGDGKKYVIQGFLDDATGIPVGLWMEKNECLLGYLEATRYMLTTYGIPMQLYPDRLGVFFDNSDKPKKEKQPTQYGKIMQELGVDMFPAYSPQAKGRIENFWKTLKRRLPHMLRRRHITTVAAANAYLPKAMQKFAKWFRKEPKSKTSSFVPMTPQNISSLTTLLSVKIPRKTGTSGVFSLNGYRFMVPTVINKKIVLCFSHKDGFWAMLENDKSQKQHTVKLLETDDCNLHMPEVTKLLIEDYFLADAKAKYRSVNWESMRQAV